MDKHKQRMAIAKACDWLFDHVRGDAMFFIPKGYYVGDPIYNLNAMHEAEKVLTFDQYHITFTGLCQSITQRAWIDGDRSGKQSAVHATAAQRAEAFLKTLNLWEGESHD